MMLKGSAPSGGGDMSIALKFLDIAPSSVIEVQLLIFQVRFFLGFGQMV